MRFRLVIFSLFAALTMACGGAPKPQPAAKASVRLLSQVDTDTARFRVEGATGADLEAAKRSATVQALVFAAQGLAGDVQQKGAAASYVESHLMDVMGFATHGKIFNRAFAAGGAQMRIGMIVKINRTALQRHLTDQAVITGSRELAKGVGRPKIMVIFDQGDCSRGNATGPLCTLGEQIDRAAADVDTIRGDILAFQRTVIDAGCMQATETTVEAETESHDRSRSSASRSARTRASASSSSSSSARARGSRSGDSGSGSASRTGSSSRSASASRDVEEKRDTQVDRASRSKFSAKSIKASDHCRSFMNRFRPMEARLWKAESRRNGLQDKMDAARGDANSKDVVTVKINQWFVDQQWELVDGDAVGQAQRVQDAMTNVKGLPQDPVAALAQLAGADIYVMHGIEEVATGGGGYMVEVNIKAYEVTSGRMLASKASRSNELADRNPMVATAVAVGNAMPKILEQIMGHWANMAREGVKTKVVLRGDFSKTRTKLKIKRILKDLPDTVDGCDSRCEWTTDLTTADTITGEFTLPAKARPDFGDYLLMSLEDEGLHVQQIIGNRTLNIIEVL